MNREDCIFLSPHYKNCTILDRTLDSKMYDCMNCKFYLTEEMKQKKAEKVEKWYKDRGMVK